MQNNKNRELKEQEMEIISGGVSNLKLLTIVGDTLFRKNKMNIKVAPAIVTSKTNRNITAI